MKQKYILFILAISLATLLSVSMNFGLVHAAIDCGPKSGEPPTGQIPTPDGKDCTCPPGQGPAKPADRSVKCQLDNPAPGQLVNLSNFKDLLGRVVNILLTFAGAIAVIFLIVGGYQYIAAHGNEEAIEKAKKTITGALVGIIIIIISFAVVAIINELLTRGP